MHMTGTMQLPSGTVPQFGFLHDIFIFGTSQTVVFLFEEYETIGYSPHFGAYETSYNPERPQYLCIYQSVLKCHELFNAVHVNNCIFIKSKYDLMVYCNYD